MTDQQQPQPRPPLWREMNAAQMALGYPLSRAHLPPEMAYSDAILAMHMIRATEIRAVAQYLIDHGLINTISQPTPRSGPRLLALLEEEAKRAEAGET